MVAMIMPEDTLEPPHLDDVIRFGDNDRILTGKVIAFYPGPSDREFIVDVISGDKTFLVRAKNILDVHRFHLAGQTEDTLGTESKVDFEGAYPRLFQLMFGMVLASNAELVRVFNALDENGRLALRAQYEPLIDETVKRIFSELGWSIEADHQTGDAET